MHITGVNLALTTNVSQPKRRQWKKFRVKLIWVYKSFPRLHILLLHYPVMCPTSNSKKYSFLTNTLVWQYLTNTNVLKQQLFLFSNHKPTKRSKQIKIILGCDHYTSFSAIIYKIQILAFNWKLIKSDNCSFHASAQSIKKYKLFVFLGVFFTFPAARRVINENKIDALI